MGPLGPSQWETDSPSAFAPSLQLGHPFLCPTKFPLAWSSLKLLLPFLLFPNPPSLWCPFPFNKVHIRAFRNIKEENKTKLHLRTVSLWKLLVFVFLSILSRFGLGLEMQGTVPGDLIRLESASNIYYLRMWALGEPFQNIWSNHAHFIRGTFEAQRGQVIIVNRYQTNICNEEDALPGTDRFFWMVQPFNGLISKMGGVICWGPSRSPIMQAQKHQEQQHYPHQALPKLWTVPQQLRVRKGCLTLWFLNPP